MKRFNKCSGAACDNDEYIDHLESRIEKLRAALGFYEDMESYLIPPSELSRFGEGLRMRTNAEIDGGKTAHTALREDDETQN